MSPDGLSAGSSGRAVAVLNNIALAAACLDPNAKASEFGVPEYPVGLDRLDLIDERFGEFCTGHASFLKREWVSIG